MRKVLIEEGTTWPNGMFISVGSIKFDPEKTYPIQMLGWDDNVGNLIGKITDIRRESDNKITGEVHFRDGVTAPDESEYYLSAYLNRVRLVEDSKDIVESADFRGVSVVPSAEPVTARHTPPKPLAFDLDTLDGGHIRVIRDEDGIILVIGSSDAADNDCSKQIHIDAGSLESFDIALHKFL